MQWAEWAVDLGMRHLMAQVPRVPGHLMQASAARRRTARIMDGDEKIRRVKLRRVNGFIFSEIFMPLIWV